MHGLKVLTCLEKFTCMTKLFPICEKIFAHITCSSCEWKKFHMHNKIVSHEQNNFTCRIKLFHMYEKFHIHYNIVSCMWKKIQCASEFHMQGKIVSHVWKKFQGNFHMLSENFTYTWISAVIFPTFISHGFCFSRTFHVLFTWFSHTYSDLVVCNSTRPVSLILYSHSASHTCIMRVLGHTDGLQDSPSGNQQPRPQNPHCTCVLFCPRIIFYWRNVTAYIKTRLLRIF